MIDTDGDPLRRAVRAEPDVISPNVLEAEELVGHEFNDDEDRTYAVREMCELGAREAIMTMTDGVLRPHAARTRAPPSRASTASACAAERSSRGPRSAPATPSWPASSPRRYQGRPVEEALAFGVACGAESTQHLGAGLVDPERVERLLGEIEVERPSVRLSRRLHNDALT